MTPGNIQRRKYPPEAHSQMAPGASLKCESTAARVSRQYRRGRARLGSVWHPGEPSVHDLVNLNNPRPRRAGRSQGRPAHQNKCPDGSGGHGVASSCSRRRSPTAPGRRLETFTAPSTSNKRPAMLPPGKAHGSSLGTAHRSRPSSLTAGGATSSPSRGRYARGASDESATNDRFRPYYVSCSRRRKLIASRETHTLLCTERTFRQSA
jgi:hypothetical protein